MQEVKSILDFNGGSIVERVNYELAKVLENINDLNTDEKTREITVKITLAPVNQRQQINIKADVTKKIRPTTSIQMAMQVGNLNGENVGIELSAQLDNQINIDGVVEERKIIKFSKAM